MDFFKLININSGRAIYNFVWATSAHTVVPLGRLSIAQPSSFFLHFTLSPMCHATAWGKSKAIEEKVKIDELLTEAEFTEDDDRDGSWITAHPTEGRESPSKIQNM